MNRHTGSCRAALAALCVLLTCSVDVGATTFEIASLENLAAASSHVLRGRFVAFESAWTRDKSAIYTVGRFRVDEAIAGQAAGTEITVILPGGRVGDASQIVIGAPAFDIGKEVVLMLDAAAAAGAAGASGGNTTFAIVGLAQGAFDIKRDAASGKTLAVSQIHELVPPAVAEEALGAAPGVEGIPLEEFILYGDRKSVV